MTQKTVNKLFLVNVCLNLNLTVIQYDEELIDINIRSDMQLKRIRFENQ